MLLFTPSKPLRNRFLKIFGPSRPPKPRISLDRVDVFEVFTIFSSHSLFALSSGLLRPIFGSSGHLLASSRAHFSWPKLPPPGPKGEIEKYTAPLFDVHMSKFASDLPNGAPGTPQNSPKPPQIHPKMRPKGPKLDVHRATS